MKTVRMLYGRTGMDLRLPEPTVVLEGREPGPLRNPQDAVAAALADPIGSPPLRELLARKAPRTVAITISDITRPVPNREFLPVLLQTLNDSGISDDRIVIIIGTGMHRPSSADERNYLVGREILSRVEVLDHRADASETLVQVRDDPPVRVCRRFAEADFRIVTGYIEPHFMAGFSGGRKGVCPALVDLETVQRFHGYHALADPKADTGILAGNPCHEISLQIARTVGVDFLLNVAITRDHRTAGIYCGDLEKAHAAGCRQVADWTTASCDAPFDLVVTNGGGYPLDQTFYQTVKGMCAALPALGPESTLLQVSECAEGLGSEAYTSLLLAYNNDWRRFVADIAANPSRTRLDQWEFQMQARVLERIGRQRLRFVTGGIPPEIQGRIGVNPVLGNGTAQERAQRAVDQYFVRHPRACIAAIPNGPYTMIERTGT
ncbi:MAG: nickel-dependent lactate racemase [Kiritimatiellaeota bacterium]|nr:nickel-dependent lactate racemase [Kiritimatiellota bacterium]